MRTFWFEWHKELHAWSLVKEGGLAAVTVTWNSQLATEARLALADDLKNGSLRILFTGKSIKFAESAARRIVRDGIATVDEPAHLRFRGLDGAIRKGDRGEATYPRGADPKRSRG
jgi:hypothetical protein